MSVLSLCTGTIIRLLLLVVPLGKTFILCMEVAQVPLVVTFNKRTAVIY